MLEIPEGWEKVSYSKLILNNNVEELECWFETVWWEDEEKEKKGVLEYEGKQIIYKGDNQVFLYTEKNCINLRRFKKGVFEATINFKWGVDRNSMSKDECSNLLKEVLNAFIEKVIRKDLYGNITDKMEKEKILKKLSRKVNLVYEENDSFYIKRSVGVFLGEVYLYNAKHIIALTPEKIKITRITEHEEDRVLFASIEKKEDIKDEYIKYSIWERYTWCKESFVKKILKEILKIKEKYNKGNKILEKFKKG